MSLQPLMTPEKETIIEFSVQDESGAHVWTYELKPASLLEDFGRGIMTDIRYHVDSEFGRPLTFTFKKVTVDTPTTSMQQTLDEADTIDEDDEGYDEYDEDEIEDDDEYDTED